MTRESRRPGPRAGLTLGFLLLVGWAVVTLDLEWSALAPTEAGWDLASRFFARALSPALASEAEFVPAGTPPLLVVALTAAWNTVMLAAAAVVLALLLAVPLSFFASSAWWADDTETGQRATAHSLGSRAVGPAIYVTSRTALALLRSVHELIWAILLLAALGLGSLAALLAIALPAAGVLAKIFSELIDEAPQDAARALQIAGAPPVAVYGFGLVSRALPDITAYAFYRFECALRASAVLGFFGFPTLGLYIRQSFASTNYGEVWTFLYVLIAIVWLFDAWSGWVRRRLLVG